MKKQLSFSILPPSRLVHGGEYAKNKRKGQRPLRLNRPIHLVLRAKRAGLKMKERKLLRLVKKYAQKFKIKIYRTSINSNHIHLLLTTHSRTSFQNFLRTTTGLMARVMGKGRLWQCLAFTRIANWGREFKILTNYIIQNQREAAGVISYQVRTG